MIIENKDIKLEIPKPKTDYNRGKVLIVDDEKFNCDIIDGFLMILGIQNREKFREFAFNGE